MCRTAAIARPLQRQARAAWPGLKGKNISKSTATEGVQQRRSAMPHIFPGRYAAQSDDPFVVFLIGMRVNRIFALRSWPRVAAAMPPMIAELKRDPSLGLLHAEFFV